MDALPFSIDQKWIYFSASAAAALLLTWIFVVIRKGRRLPGENVFQASRLSRGNRVLPAQVAITPDSVTLYQPQLIGKLEESIHIAHISSIKIDTNLVFSDIFIETTGGRNPIICHGHTKGDAVKIKAIIERFQSASYKKA